MRPASAAALAVVLTIPVFAQMYRLTSTSGLELHNVAAEAVEWRGRKAVRLVETASADGESIAILAGSEFRDGVIEAEIAAHPRAGAGEGARGFAGVAFRVPLGTARFEAFYLRPTNGRANDQLRRNHSTQYISAPDWPWQRLRKEFPGVYESYADLVPGQWTKVRIEVAGAEARLYVNGASQPTLIVNDLKLAPASGRVALWIGSGTEAYFSNVKVTPKASK